MAAEGKREEGSLPETMQAVVGGPSVDGVATLVERPVPTATGSQLLIKVAYTGINRLDILQITGKYKLPPGITDIVGLEVSGTVVGKGPDCERDIPLGTNIAALLIGGAFAEYAVCEEGQALVLPAEIDLRTAAAIPETWFTAFQLLHVVAHVQKGDTVLVHAAGSGVGTAAIQLSIAAGAEVIATAGTKGKLDTAARLGAKAGFNRKEGSWGEGVLKATDGKGATVVLDCVGGSYVKDNSVAIAREGRWVLFGLMGGISTTEPLLRTVLAKRVQLLGSTLRTRSSSYKAELVASFNEVAMPKFVDGTFAPVIDSEYALSDIGAAVAHVASNASAGKVLLKVSKDE